TKMQIRKTLSHPNLQERLSEACKESLAQYGAIKPGMSPSIGKNYVVKLLHRFDALFSSLEYPGEDTAIKIIAAEVDKEQDYLFFHLLTLMGMDVLLIQTEKDVPVHKNLLELSRSFVCGEFKKVELPRFHQKMQAVSKPRQGEVPNAEQSISRPTVYLPPRKDRMKESIKNAREGSLSESSALTTQPGSSRAEKSFEELASLASSVVMIGVCNRSGEIISSGSGIMVARGGYILTNNHVINKGYFYAVSIEGEKEIYKTDEVIKYNSALDLALIRISRELSPLPVYKGKANLVRGQRVVAIGSPLGLFNSVSDGIISGFRVIDGVDMIQFTAPISHGSSGGAVLNMYGEVIGISTAGIDSGQNLNLAMGYEGINLFIRGFVG
ncbi:MAG: serine protease, partial [Filifactor alocis]|nr:serine protease [Filifactor alocis]